MQKRPEPSISQKSRPDQFNILLSLWLTCSLTHLQIWQKRRIVNSTKPTIRRLNFCDIYFLKISVHVCISVAQQENTVAILPKIWKRPCSSLGEQGLSSMEKQKNFRAFCARKALRTLRSTQCPQNWLTMMEAPPRLELGVADLQSAALPLGYGAICSPAQTELI